MGADWGPIFSGLIIAICLIIAIPFIDVEDSDGTYKEEILQESYKKIGHKKLRALKWSFFYRKALYWNL